MLFPFAEAQIPRRPQMMGEVEPARNLWFDGSMDCFCRPETWRKKMRKKGGVTTEELFRWLR